MYVPLSLYTYIYLCNTYYQIKVVTIVTLTNSAASILKGSNSAAAKRATLSEIECSDNTVQEQQKTLVRVYPNCNNIIRKRHINKRYVYHAYICFVRLHSKLTV